MTLQWWFFLYRYSAWRYFVFQLFLYIMNDNIQEKIMNGITIKLLDMNSEKLAQSDWKKA